MGSPYWLLFSSLACCLFICIIWRCIITSIWSSPWSRQQPKVQHKLGRLYIYQNTFRCGCFLPFALRGRNIQRAVCLSDLYRLCLNLALLFCFPGFVCYHPRKTHNWRLFWFLIEPSSKKSVCNLPRRVPYSRDDFNLIYSGGWLNLSILCFSGSHSHLCPHYM